MENSNKDLVLYSSEFLEKIENLKNRINSKRVENSKKETPQNRKDIKGGTGYEYVEEDYLRAELDRQFIWSYISQKQETVYMEASFNGNTIKIPFAEKTLGYLEIIDEGIKRSFPAPGYQQYQYTKGAVKGWNSLVNPELACRGAWTRGLSFAINRLTRIADDVYRKTAEEYELKKELQEEIEELSEKLSPEEKIKLSRTLKQYGSMKNLPEDVANNTIDYIKQQIGEQ